MKFTEEQWVEIYRVRSQLEAYRDKIQPYPAYPESENGTHTPEHITKIYTHLSIDKKALELQKRIVSLEEEIKKLRTHASKKSGRYNRYA